MLDMKMRDHAQLLGRARAALETPADLDEAARTALIEDIAEVEGRIAKGALPWAIDIHLGRIDQGASTSVYAAPSHSALLGLLASHCRHAWPAPGENPDCASLDDEAVIRRFQDHAPDVSISAWTVRDAPDVRHDDLFATGSYCILSTVHLSTTTSDLLDRWSNALAHERPVAVAGSFHGWFVSTREVGPIAREQLPDDLRAAIRFANDRGFDYILFDCDARHLPGLPVHNW